MTTRGDSLFFRIAFHQRLLMLQEVVLHPGTYTHTDSIEWSGGGHRAEMVEELKEKD